MYTRAQYLNAECNYNDYTNQFVTSKFKQWLRDNHINLIDACKKSTDKHLNNVMPLSAWDKLGVTYRCYFYNAELVKSLSDYDSLAHRVCVVKQAIRAIIKEDSH